VQQEACCNNKNTGPIRRTVSAEHLHFGCFVNLFFKVEKMSKWPKVRLVEVVDDITALRTFDVMPEQKVLDPTIKSATHTMSVGGCNVGAGVRITKRVRIKPGDLVFSRLHTQNGAFAFADQEYHATGTFIPLSIADNKIDRRFLFWALHVCIPSLSASDTVGRETYKTSDILALEIPLPPLAEQQRIVARIEQLAAKIEEARGLRQAIESDEHGLLLSAYHKIVAAAPRRPMNAVAPLFRRPVSIDLEKEYPQVAVRSFGKGTFHKSLLQGTEITWQRPYLVKTGDILISNIKAWEGAVAVAKEEDDGRVGSHRYLTCVPVHGISTARFVCFHLLTPEGIYELEQASPGSADRNRTLNVKALKQIPIPVPPYDQQRYFDELYQKVESLKRLQANTAAELDALLPSVLDKTFKGEL